ncbi:hypothetical protein K2O51_31715 (plasmid) [Cupriavidus pinatubonensis]|uniref:hypothetical protein n=1 Tax=Cupriavidus pinatubonensis TaxID=248026 RepID=UPI001C73548A|nr:hypothetical protein [Cupriavidus pinatubonensis]QYY33594.1 hypothetical protein K2O51_31715 [Cupriavidus pinatubonensis]
MASIVSRAKRALLPWIAAGVTVLAPATGHAAPSQTFLRDLGQVVGQMLASYSREAGAPLQVLTFDTGDATVRGFLRATSNHSADELLAMQAYDQMKVARAVGGVSESIELPTCVIFYDSSRSDLLDGYVRSGAFDYVEALHYLAAHEFGHCMEWHQSRRGAGSTFRDVRASERLADLVALTYFATNGNWSGATRILDLNAKVSSAKPGDPHSNVSELRAALEQLQATPKRRGAMPSTMFGVYQVAADLQRRISSNLKD